MILQALYDYYQRKAPDPESRIAPQGWEWKEIPFLVVIDREGNFVRFEDTREGDSRKKRAKAFLVPQGGKRTVGVKAFLLWDNIEYALGANPRNRYDIRERCAAFKEKIESISCPHPDIQAVIEFLNKNPIAQIEKKNDPSWAEITEGNGFVTFKIEGSKFSSVCETLPKENISCVSPGNDVCLITGDKVSALRLHPAIKGVRGTNTSGGSIVAFNLPAFCSYGKKQNQNAPVGQAATSSYTTALNVLLGKDSPNKVSIGDITIAFWAQKKDEILDMESTCIWLFQSDKDNPDKGIAAVSSLYKAVETGRMPPDDGDNRFYVLGLSPNAARISVRFWKTGTIREFAEKIYRHFRDFEIIHGPKDVEHLSLYQILTATALNYKITGVPPNLAGAVITSILDGLPYPRTLLQQCLRRIRAEQSRKNSRTGKLTQNVNRARAAILKAYVNRFNRFYNKQMKEVQMGLDCENRDIGYLIGRLFAVLEKNQEEANPGINTTIRDRFYGAASTTPVTVFPRLLKLKNYHLAKLHPGRKIYMEKCLQDIMNEMRRFPSQLTMEQQAMFALGYYHQRQKFFERKENKI